jgi:hypothetical protein
MMAVFVVETCLSREFIACDPVYARAKDSGFVKLGGFLVFLVYGFMRRLHALDTAIGNEAKF